MAGMNHVPISMAASDSMQNRKRNVTIAGIDSSPGSIDEADDMDRDDKRRQPVKRACNECRQQKVSCSLDFAKTMRHSSILVGSAVKAQSDLQ